MTTTTKEIPAMKLAAMEALKEAKRLDALGTFEEIADSLRIMYNGTTGKGYSPKNSYILFQQQIFAKKTSEGEFAGFGQWKNAGRKVKKGAKAFYVYSPVIKKGKDNEGTEYTAIKGCFFQAVFAKSDTEAL